MRPAENVHTVYKKGYLGHHTNQDEGMERKMSILNGDSADTLHDDDMECEKRDLTLAVDTHEYLLFHEGQSGNKTFTIETCKNSRYNVDNDDSNIYIYIYNIDEKYDMSTNLQSSSNDNNNNSHNNNKKIKRSGHIRKQDKNRGERQRIRIQQFLESKAREKN